MWDPIGLADSDCPRDEYDSYLLQVVGRLRRGETVEKVTEYLLAVERDLMGVGKAPSEGQSPAEQAVVAIKSYLATLPPGRLSVR